MSSSEIEIFTGLPSAQVTLLDHARVVVATAPGSLRVALAAGIYRVQVEAGASITEDLVAVPANESATHNMHLLLPTVTPVKSASINHEWHSAPARNLSINPTFVLGSGGRLVIFTRVTHRLDEMPLVSAHMLELFDDQGRSLLERLPAEQMPGHAGLSIDIAPGTYLLRDSTGGGLGPVFQSVPVSDDWTTYLFMPAAPDRHDERAPWMPVPSAAVAHLSEIDRPFEPYDYGSDEFFAAEMALDGLRSGQLVLPEGGWDAVMKQPSLSPMLGIYLGYAALASIDPPLRLLDELAHPLDVLVPRHPDVVALKWAFMDRAGIRSAFDFPALASAPMLGFSYRALLARDAFDPTVLAQDSLAERVATRQRPDGVWLPWDALERGAVEADPDSILRAAAVLGELVDLSGVDRETDPPLPAEWPSTDFGQVAPEVADLAVMLSQMAEHITDAGPVGVGVGELSRQLGQPFSRVIASLVEITGTPPTS